MSHELIQTSSWLYELKKIKKDCDKTYMVTYQVGDLIKVGLHLKEGFMGSGPLPFFQNDQIVSSILVSSKWKSVYNHFLNHEISFWKQKNRIHVKTILFCVYINEFQVCALVTCVAYELCASFLQTWTFFWTFLKGIVH